MAAVQAFESLGRRVEERERKKGGEGGVAMMNGPGQVTKKAASNKDKDRTGRTRQKGRKRRREWTKESSSSLSFVLLRLPPPSFYSSIFLFFFFFWENRRILLVI